MIIYPARHQIRNCAGIALIVVCGMLSPASAQKTRQELPVVIAGQMPLYPVMARAARIQGVVKVKVTTDGKKVIFVHAKSGPPMLANFAEKSILTWQFLPHKPTTFVTTIEYVIEEPAQCVYSNDALNAKLPLEIHIIAKALQTCDPAVETNP